MDGRPPSARPKTTVAARPPSSTMRAIGSQRAVLPPSRPKTSFGGAAATAAVAASRPGTALAGRPSTGMSIAGQFFSWAENDGSDSRGSESVVARPGSRSQRGRIGTAQGQSNRTAAGRPGSRMGTAKPLNLTQRPVTQQGLAGVRPASSRGAKATELTAELKNLTNEIQHHDEDKQNYLVYEKKAEALALELKDFQGQLADYNMVVDKLNTNTDLNDMQEDLTQVRSQNETETQTVDTLFAERRQKEEMAKQLEAELEEERRMADNMLSNMDPTVRDKYMELKDQNEQLSEDLRLKQQELDQLTTKKADLEDELAVSPLKQEAMVMHERLGELEAKRDAVIAEINAEGTPEQQRERLLEKVKKDNEEIVSIEKQSAEALERNEQCHEEMKELDEEYEEQQGEKNQKYKELRQKEQQIDEFLSTYDMNRMDEQARISALQENIVRLLNIISRNVANQDKTSLVTGLDEYELDSTGTTASQANTVPELQEAHVRLQEELIKVDEMEEKAREEIDSLKQKMEEMRTEMSSFTDIESLRGAAEIKREALTREKDELEQQISVSQNRLTQLQSDVGSLKAKLNDNETHLKLINLEKKLQYAEKNNFAVRDAIESRQAETNVAPVREQVLAMTAEYNSLLIQHTVNRIGSAANIRPVG